MGFCSYLIDLGYWIWDVGFGSYVREMGFGIWVGIWDMAVATWVVGFRMRDLG